MINDPYGWFMRNEKLKDMEFCLEEVRRFESHGVCFADWADIGQLLDSRD